MLTGGDRTFSWGARERLPGRLTKANLVPTHILVKQNKVEKKPVAIWEEEALAFPRPGE